MKIAILLFIIKLTYAGTNELCIALSTRCQLDAERVDEFFYRFSKITQKLELIFHHASNANPQYQDLLRELDALYIWQLLTTLDPSLLEYLKVLRDEVTKEVFQEKSCIDWINLLLGDGIESNFEGSYLELLIKSLSVTRHTKLVEMSVKQSLFVRLELRRMHIERKCFLFRSEELHELYCSYIIVYTSLVNHFVGHAMLRYAQQHTLSLTLIPKEAVGRFPNYYLDHSMNFFKRFIDPQKDFFVFKEKLHLRKSCNFYLAYQKRLAILALIPNVAVRREKYFDEEKALLFNFKRIESQVSIMHEEKSNFASLMKWDSKDLSNLTLAFDLVDSLISFQREKIAVAKVRCMLLEIIGYMKYRTALLG